LINVRTSDATVKEDGFIIAGAGHVHGGAEKLTITKPSCNNLQVAQSVPTWGLASHPFYNVRPVLHEPGPVGMSAFNTPTGIPVTDGQTIRLNSIYDNMQPHTRVMGIYVIYIAEKEPSDPVPQPCGGAPNDTFYGPGTTLPGRSGPIPFKIPLTGLDANGNAVTIKGPPGPFRRLKSGATVTVGDRFFNTTNIRLRRGAKLNYNFASGELHNLTLANGPLGIGSPNLDGNRTFTQRFTRAGTYRLFCALHPVQMSQRVIVKPKRKKHRRG
jgi:plastocyanin